MTPPSLTRRDFLAHSALAAALTLTLVSRAAFAAANPTTNPTPSRSPIIAFSKPFQKFTAEQTADFVAAIGWDGIECPLRAKGQIEPERAADEVPLFAAALRRRNRDIYIATTDITSVSQKHTETVLRAVAKNGIKRIRLGFYKYDLKQSPADQHKEIAPALRDIAAACKDLGIQAGFQNHSGRNYVGAPVWDVFSIIRDLDPAHMGMCFDIGHATIEGGLSWPIEAKLIAPFYTAVFVKDFLWKKNAKGVWAESWCNLGEGMVNREFFTELKKSAYAGPICQHHEYELGDTATMTAHFKKDLAVLKTWLA
ncbi:MAG: sugar phosphate isomerase/epimerase [Undibacterium sp.]|nr:sugar phosphate isomerase/epimerase [Opitutaceae bacterium]